MSNFEKYVSEFGKIPEVAFKEKKTTKKIERIVKGFGLTFTPFKNVTGGYVDFGVGTPKHAFRTDIDAILVELDGKKVVKHACGHNIHIAVALSVLERLVKAKTTTPIRFIFQPAEEIGQGANFVVNNGVLDGIEYLFGLHVRPLEELPLGKFSPSIEHGASKMIEVILKGHNAHAARPHLNSNAIEVGMSIMNQLSLVHPNPMIPASVKFTSFHADAGSHNTIPGDAVFTIDVRSQDNSVMSDLTFKMNEVISAVCNFNHIAFEINEITDLKAAEPNVECIDLLRNSIVKVLGKNNLAKPIVTPGGEDFHEYSFQIPTLKSAMLGVGCGVTPGLHSPNMKLNVKEASKSVDIFFNLFSELNIEK